MKKSFFYKCKLSLALLYLAYKFIDNFKTKRNDSFYRMVSKTERIFNTKSLLKKYPRKG